MDLRHLCVLLAAACSGPGSADKDAGPATEPAYFEFHPSVAAKAYEATIAEEAVAAHRISSTLLAASAVVVADEKVQDLLNIDGGGDVAGFRASFLDCWTRPAFPRLSFAIDYTGCGSFNMQGGVFVEDHPSGPLLFNFENFTFNALNPQRTIGGTFALDTRGAYPDALYWKTYNTDSENPGLDQAVEIGVTLDRTAYGVSYEGGSSVDFLNQQWSMWGVLTVGKDSPDPITVVHGARTAAEVASDEPTGADVLKSSLNWLSCRCPTSGISAYDMPLQFTSVTVDLDDLEVDPDAIDDPDLTLKVNFDIAGTGVLTHTGCGEYDVDYESEPLVVTVPSNDLVTGISFFCDTLAIPDRARCDAFVRAAQSLPDDLLQIEVSEADANQTALQAVDEDFDTTWCVTDP